MKRAFIDTNILIYLYTSTEDSKRVRAASLLLDHEVVISTQVLNELTNVLLKKYQFSWETIRNVFAEISGMFPIHIVTKDTVLQAYDIGEQYKFSYYDSLIVASRLESSCELLFTEDLHNGQIIKDSLTIKNPFK